MCVLSTSGVVAAAEEDDDAPASDAAASDQPKSDAPESTAPKTEGASVGVSASATETVAPPPPVEATPTEALDDWHVEVHGYFRAPMSLGISSRPNPDKPDGPSHGQISYGPNRIVDWSYYSFAYTRLQEQDWAEVTFHAKKKHVDAAVGWMGYWLSATGFRNPDAAGVPGVASLKLDTDIAMGEKKSNIALQMGAWWPGFGYFEKYDTFTLGRFRHIGEQLKFAVPVNSDLTLTAIEGFGTARDGQYSYSTAASSPLYASKVGADLLAYVNLNVKYKKNVDVSLHYNTEWSRDPYLTQMADADSGKAYSQVADARLSVVGAEANLAAPYAGRLWISPSHISVKNGWALQGPGGTEVMHAQGGVGIATNYLGWSNAPTSSTGSGSMFNLGFLYENSLSSLQGKTPEEVPHDVRLNIFGLLANSTLDLPAGSDLKKLPAGLPLRDGSLKQFKYGADVAVRALNWLEVMLRYDSVNYDTAHAGYIFSAITSRLSVYSHFLSGESIYLQYSRYRYGDKMVLAGLWPTNVPLVAGAEVIQGGTYAGKKPDQDVVKLQATVSF